MKALLPRGLDICYTPAMYLHKPWYEKYSRREREAILPLMLYARYRSKKWYVVADDQTLFSPLALAQWLGGFDPFEEWYIGSVSESEELRKLLVLKETQFARMEAKKAELDARIGELREFERDYRSQLRNFIEGHLKDLDSSSTDSASVANITN